MSVQYTERNISTALSAGIEECDELSQDHALRRNRFGVLVEDNIAVIRRAVEEALQDLDDVFECLAFARQQSLRMRANLHHDQSV